MLQRSADLECSWVCVMALVNRVGNSKEDSTASGPGTAWAWPGALLEAGDNSRTGPPSFFTSLLSGKGL